MLYPDRVLPDFLERNRIRDDALAGIPDLYAFAKSGDTRIVRQDVDGHWRFNSDFTNANDLKAMLLEVGDDAPSLKSSEKAILALYESVFDHKSFTGRSGTMFGFEGLGSIYWHMVSKLLLAVMETFFAAVESNAPGDEVQRLGELYYKVRAGIGFNKTPENYGAFPTDPYSHTPKHAGARQPGMTGQVKEEVITRFGELGIRVQDGRVSFRPRLLRPAEFLAADREFRYLGVDNNWQTLALTANSLAFTWCQVPIVYTLSDDASVSVELDGKTQSTPTLDIAPDVAEHLFHRNGRISKITVCFPPSLLHNN
jgi:hypothetical protein